MYIRYFSYKHSDQTVAGIVDTGTGIVTSRFDILESDYMFNNWIPLINFAFIWHEMQLSSGLRKTEFLRQKPYNLVNESVDFNHGPILMTFSYFNVGRKLFPNIINWGIEKS
jgi:hypothetical protein